MSGRTARILRRLAEFRTTCPRSFQFTCACSTILLVAFFFVGIVAARFLPPLPPSWSAEQTVNYYHHHQKGIQAAATLIGISSAFYLTMTVAISAQMQRIPNLHYSACALQLAAGTASSVIIVLSGLVLAVATYRLERYAEITQTLNDFFWILIVMGGYTFVAQYSALAYGIIVDNGATPVFPKTMAITNILASIIFLPGIVAVHTVKTGPLAWNGIIAFWIPAVVWGILIVFDAFCLIQATFTEIDTREEVDTRNSL
jgi:hypothetical protein